MAKKATADKLEDAGTTQQDVSEHIESQSWAISNIEDSIGCIQADIDEINKTLFRLVHLLETKGLK